MIASTITIPVYSQPHFLHTTLHALVRNSAYKHRIIIVWSDSDRIGPPFGQKPGGFTDFETTDKFIASRRFASVRHFLDDHAGWLRDHGIETLDVTDRALAFRESFARGHVWHGAAGTPEGGVDTAFKNNLGLEVTDTEWTIPNWDCDFYPAPGWDRSVFDYAQREKPKRELLIPMHVQPKFMTAGEAAKWNVWRDSPAVACHRLTIATTYSVGGQACVTDDDVKEFVRFEKRGGEIIREPAGKRERLHWVPWILRSDDLRSVGGFNYQGGGYDLEFDDRMGRLGFTKVGFCDAFVFHKAFPPVVGCYS